MKKTLLVTAILSGLVSAAAGAATVYNADGTQFSIGGRAEVRGLFGDAINGDAVDDNGDALDDGTMEDLSRARINFAGETQISENLTGFGFVEYQINNDATDSSETDLTNRYIYVGLGTQVGDFSYGKQDTAGVQLSNMTDIAEYHSGIQQIIDAASDTSDNVFLYSGTFADALTVQVDYQAVKDKDADAYALSAVYAFDFGLDLGASYSAQDAATSADEAYQATFGIAYTVDQLYLATTYATGESSKDADIDSLEVAAQYQFTDQFAMIAMYGNAEDNDVDTQDFFALEANYKFNSSLNTYASYKFNELDGGEDELVVGAKYAF